MNKKGICIFPQGGNITLGQAKPLIDTLLDDGQCKVCGNININYFTSDNTSAGLLKADYTTHDVCQDKCIGPFSFKNTTTSATHSAAKRLNIPLSFEGGDIDWLITLLPAMMAFGLSFAMFLGSML